VEDVCCHSRLAEHEAGKENGAVLHFFCGMGLKICLVLFLFISRNWPESLFVDAQENVNAGTAKDGRVSRSSEEKRD
jgi:hypothetical protein